MAAHCAIKSPKKNQVDFPLSQVRSDAATTQTASNTIHSFRGSGGISFADKTRRTSKTQNSPKPIMHCSESTPRNVLCEIPGPRQKPVDLMRNHPADTQKNG